MRSPMSKRDDSLSEFIPVDGGKADGMRIRLNLAGHDLAIEDADGSVSTYHLNEVFGDDGRKLKWVLVHVG